MSLKTRFLASLVSSLTLTAVLLAPKTAWGFGGEDPVKGYPWYHEAITKDAAKDIFTDEAAASIAWHADYVDSYLYNPLWWIPGGLGRFKASLATAPELEKVHFDDLFDANKVRYMFRRYTSGTMAGLMWAKEHNDVAAAQNVVGVSLHAIQDFYSHSNWIDDKNRRDKTYFQTPFAERPSLPLYTGAYEHEDHLGVKHHGKFLYACSIMNQPGVKQMLSVACGAGSPMGGSEICRAYDACEKGTAVRFSVQGVKIPDNVIYQAPTGIALDNTWLAEIGVKERGLKDITGAQAFTTARTLATTASRQWLKTLETNMIKAGAGDFWNQVKTKGASQDIRERQYENYSQFPYTFISAGPYPPENLAAEEYYLRVRLQTASEGGSGTDADIRLKADGKEFLLDYMPRSVPVLAYNDFEQGDDATYVAGPFTKVPSSLELYNDSANTGEVLKALGKTLLSAVVAPFKGIGSMFNTITGKEADWIGTEHKVWTPEQLAAVPTEAQAPGKTIKVPLMPPIVLPAGQAFSIESNGDEKGYYKANGFIVKTGESVENGPQGWYEFQVTLSSLDCIKESKWDRGSSSDEPFVLSLLTPLPGDLQKYRTEPFDDVDAGETRGIGKVFQRVRVPKDFGMLNLAVSFMEHDDESGSKRDELLNTFAGQVKESSDKDNRGLLTAMGAAIGEDWKLKHINVYAWSRGGAIRTGTVLDKEANQWIKGKQRATFNLNPALLKNTGVTTDDLLPFISETGATSTATPAETTAETGGTTGADPSTTDPATTTDPNATDPNAPANGTGGTTGNNSVLGAVGKIGGIFKKMQDWSVKVDSVKVSENGTLDVVVSYKNGRKTPLGLQAGSLSALVTDADGIGFSDRGNLYRASVDTPEFITQTIRVEGDSETKVKYIFDLPEGAVPLKTLTIKEYGRNAHTIDLSSVQIPNAVEPVTTPVPGTVGATSTFAEFGNYDVRLDGVQRGRGNKLYAYFTLKNVSGDRQQFYAGDMNVRIVDADGVGTRSDGNLYRASGGMLPSFIKQTIRVEPKVEAKLRFVFPLSKGVVPKKIIISTHNDAIQSFDLPAIP